VRAVENCRACQLATALQLLAVMICKCSMYPITNPNPSVVTLNYVTILLTVFQKNMLRRIIGPKSVLRGFIVCTIQKILFYNQMNENKMCVPLST
jgi:hypothetical protein